MGAVFSRLASRAAALPPYAQRALKIALALAAAEPMARATSAITALLVDAHDRYAVFACAWHV